MLTLDKKKIAQLKFFLDEINYNSIINEYIQKPISPIILNSLEKKASIFIELFYLHRVVLLKDAQKFIGKNYLKDLLTLGLIIRDGDKLKPKYEITSINGYYFIFSYEITKNFDYTYYGPASLLLTKYLPLNCKVGNILDLGTGTGLHAILLSKNASQITGVDISKKTVNTANFNVILNNVDDVVKIVEGDLFSPFKHQKFDLIIANPPVVPIPNNYKYPLSGAGGEDGLLFLKKILLVLENYMTTNGSSIILGYTPGDLNAPFIVKEIKKIIKINKLDVKILLLQRDLIEHEILYRSLYLALCNPKLILDHESEMRRIYSQINASYVYNYLLKIKRSSTAKLKIIDLAKRKKKYRKVKISVMTSFETLEFLFRNYFQNKIYERVIETFEIMQKFHKTFNLPYNKNIFLPLCVSYMKLGRKKEAAYALSKAKRRSLVRI